MDRTPELVKFILDAPQRLFMPIITYPGSRITGTTVREMVTDPAKQCAAGVKNFVISSGCDVPAQAPLQNLWAFFTA